MKNISLPRLWRLLRRQMPGTVTLTLIFAVWTVLFTASHLLDVGFSDLSEEMLREGVKETVDKDWRLMPNILCIMACMMFSQLKKRQTAYGYLMLPATMQEKFIVSLLLYMVVLLPMVAGFVVADLLCAALYCALCPPVFATGLPELLHHLLLRDYYADGHFVLPMLLDDLCPLLWFHSVCMLCATVFRRNALLFAIGLLLPCFLFLWLRSHLATELAGGLYDTWTLPVSAVLSLLAVTHYAAAYKLFPRRTLTGHKYLAIL